MSKLSNSFPFLLSTPEKEGSFNVSKWLKHQVLLDLEEMRELLEHIYPARLYNVSEITANPCVDVETFLEKYARYIEELKKGFILPLKEIRSIFSSALSEIPDVFYAYPVREGGFLLKFLKPAVQMQVHHFLPSTLDGKIHPMVLSQDSVSWGIQFAYPQIFQDPKSHLFSKVGDSFPNTSLFLKMARFFRNHTQPVTFLWNGNKVVTSLRLGKKAYCWIKKHPQLQEKGMEVYVYP